MTCRDCLHWDKCFKNNGTRYYGTDCACNNVEELCEWFIRETEQLKWIPVTERLPEKNRCILICSKQGGIAEGAYMGGGAWIQYRWNAVGMDVTHWMPLPEPPKEDA